MFGRAISNILLAAHRGFIDHLGPNFETVTRDYRGEYTVFVSTQYPIERSIFRGDYEAGHLALMQTLVSAGDVALDIGANVGAITLPLAGMVGTSGRVHAFEPGPTTFARLARNVAANPRVASRVIINQFGVADAEGELIWREFAHMPGNAGFHLPDGSWSARALASVSVTTVDAYVASRHLGSVDFIKVDTEGFEPQVLRGATHTLGKHRPLLSVETLQEYREMPGREYFRVIAGLLAELRYSAFRFDGRLVKASPDAHAVDTICIPDERIDEVSQRLGVNADGQLSNI